MASLRGGLREICEIVTRLIGRDSTLRRTAHDGVGIGAALVLPSCVWGPMRVRFAIILLLWILPLPALAQTSADDGVRAFVQGDYASAARILSPLAEASDDPDATAQFFMGMLYAAGKGVRSDSIRACT